MNRLLQILDGRKIAIVGNGTPVFDHSADIDSAEVVVRFNDFYNMPTGRVGRRVDIVLQTIAKAWFDRFHAGQLAASLATVREQKPAIFLVKRPDNYRSDAHAVYGKGVRIDNLASLFEPWWRFTTGTAALCYLAQNLKNAEVRCYGFQDEAAWQNYIATDAKHYSEVAAEERNVMLEAIAKLESLTITEPKNGIVPKCIVVPIKANSSGAPMKNRILLRGCLEKLQGLGITVYATGDDTELLHEVKDICVPVPLSAIGAMDDVTKTLRRWQVETGFCGDVALVQCTSPKLKVEWVAQCFDAMSMAPVAATCVELGFKPTAIFREENGVFLPNSQALPPASVARQMLPRAVRITGAVETFHTDALTRESFFEYGTLEPVIIDESDALDVDTEEQLKEAMKCTRTWNTEG